MADLCKGARGHMHMPYIVICTLALRVCTRTTFLTTSFTATLGGLVVSTLNGLEFRTPTSGVSALLGSPKDGIVHANRVTVLQNIRGPTQ